MIKKLQNSTFFFSNVAAVGKKRKFLNNKVSAEIEVNALIQQA